MNILFVHEVDLLNKVVFEIHNLAEILSKNHNVFAVDYEESWKRKNIFDPGTLRTQEFKNVSRAYNGRGFTLRRPGMIKFPLLSRLSAFFTHYCEIENIIKEEKIDAIILYSAPTNGMQTIYLAKKYNIPVIFRSIDILNQLVPPGEKLPLRFAMMRHDIDRKPMRALLTARVEQEVGYHYEVLGKANGDHRN